MEELLLSNQHLCLLVCLFALPFLPPLQKTQLMVMASVFLYHPPDCEPPSAGTLPIPSRSPKQSLVQNTYKILLHG